MAYILSSYGDLNGLSSYISTTAASSQLYQQYANQYVIAYNYGLGTSEKKKEKTEEEPPKPKRPIEALQAEIDGWLRSVTA